MINEKSVIPGDLQRLEVYINGKDVAAAVTDCQLYFDLVGGMWTAKIYFEDSMNLLTTLPIKSGAEVKVKVATKFDSVGDDDKEFEYVVYNITDKVDQNHMQYTYVVHAACKAFLIDQKKRVYKFYEGNAGDAIASIASEFLEASIGDTRTPTGDVRFITPNWTPMSTIAWAAKWALYDGKADYMFFQSDNDKFDFMPVSVMYKDRDSGIKFIKRPNGIRERGEYKDDPATTFIAAQQAPYDALKAGVNGYFASTNMTFDFVKKTWKEEKFTHADAEGAENEFAGMEESHMSFTPSHDVMYQGSENIYATFKDWTGSRRAELMKLDREKLFVQTPCAVGAWKWLGHFVKVDLPSMEDMTEEQYDPARKGKYLITAVALMLNKADAVTNYELAKLKLEKE